MPRKKAGPDDIAAPPVEQMGEGLFTIEQVHDRKPNGQLDLKGITYRRRPMIEILGAAGMFTEGELKALRHYRHHADIADRSLVRDSLCLQRGGGGSPTIDKLNAIRITVDCERAAGSLVDLLRSVAVYDQSLSQVAMQRFGSVDQRRERRNKKGEAVKIITSIEPPRKALDIVKLEMRVVAERVEAEVNAAAYDRTKAA